MKRAALWFEIILMVTFAAAARASDQRFDRETALPPAKGTATRMEASNIRWAGKAGHRVVVCVRPRGISGGRKTDSSPAIVHLDFQKLFGFSQPPNLDTMQVMRVDPKTGDPISYGRFRDGLSEHDLPFRFDADDLDPKQFSFMYNVTGRSPAGNVVFTHIQEGDQPSYYAIYADPDEVTHGAPPRRPQLGDCDALYRLDRTPLVGMLQTAPSVVDWRGDGRIELLVGTYAGYLVTYRSQGLPGDPEFQRPLDFVEAGGKPIFNGFGSGPKPLVVDWDGDGDLDLLVGLEAGQGVKFYENVAGPGRSPVFEDRGALCDKDGKRILTPPEPCPELPIYTQDYAPYPEAVDWNGNGRLDLLLGGYVTGMVFYYRNVNRGRGAPVLEYQGPLEADGKIIDVGWTAAPTTADLRGAGVRDLICGSMRVRPNGGMEPDAPALHYYLNVGTPNSPRLREIPFPLEDDRWDGLTGFALPRAVDWDGDGKMDLVVGSDSVRLLRNVGDREHPQFRNEGSLKGPWGHYPVAGCLSVADLKADSRISLVQSEGSRLSLAAGQSPTNPRAFHAAKPLRLASGQAIQHLSETGDDFCFGLLCHWDRKQAWDLLVGDAQGYVWLYRRADTPDYLSLGPGARLELADGGYVRVGAGAAATQWDTHVGVRATVGAGDFNGDRVNDLMVGDAFGNITYFQNVGGNEAPRFAPGKIVLRGSGRAFVTVTDWNGDGLLDLVVGWSGEGINICLNEGTVENPRFRGKTRVEIPVTLPYPCPAVCDWDADGDQDIITTCSYGFLYSLDRTFVEQGYAQAEVLRVEKKPGGR